MSFYRLNKARNCWKLRYGYKQKEQMILCSLLHIDSSVLLCTTPPSIESGIITECKVKKKNNE